MSSPAAKAKTDPLPSGLLAAAFHALGRVLQALGRASIVPVNRN